MTSLKPVCAACGRTIKGDRVRCPYCGVFLEGYEPPPCADCQRPIPPEREVCMYCGGSPVGSEDKERFVAYHSGGRSGRFRWLKIGAAFGVVGAVGLGVGAFVFEWPVEAWGREVLQWTEAFITVLSS